MTASFNDFCQNIAQRIQRCENQLAPDIPQNKLQQMQRQLAEIIFESRDSFETEYTKTLRGFQADFERLNTEIGRLQSQIAALPEDQRERSPLQTRLNQAREDLRDLEAGMVELENTRRNAMSVVGPLADRAIALQERVNSLMRPVVAVAAPAVPPAAAAAAPAAPATPPPPAAPAPTPAPAASGPTPPVEDLTTILDHVRPLIVLEGGLSENPALLRNLKGLLERHTGGASERIYCPADFETLYQVRAILQRILPKIQGRNLSLSSEIHTLLNTMNIVRGSMVSAFERSVACLRRASEAVLMSTPSTETERRARLFAWHDLYWDLTCPLEGHMRLQDCLAMAHMQPPPAEVFSADIQKLEFLIRTKNSLGVQVLRPSREFVTELYHHKISYLRNKMVQAQQSHRPQRVVILGGGLRV